MLPFGWILSAMAAASFNNSSLSWALSSRSVFKPMSSVSLVLEASSSDASDAASSCSSFSSSSCLADLTLLSSESNSSGVAARETRKKKR